jgi:Protein of unknown function (DUF3631)
LLADIHQVFERRKETDFLCTTELITELCTDDDAAWVTYNKGKPITARQVNKQLSAYGINSKQIRLNTFEKMRGFDLSQFTDAFTRYLSDTTENIRYSGTKAEKPSNGAGLAVHSNENCTDTIRYKNNDDNEPVPPCTGTENLSGTAQVNENIEENIICTAVPDKNGVPERTQPNKHDVGRI